MLIDPVSAALLAMLILVVIGGVWGYTVIRGVMERKTVEAGGGGGELDALREEHARLEDRLRRVEEEVDFLRELRAPSTPGSLADGGASRDEGPGVTS